MKLITRMKIIEKEKERACERAFACMRKKKERMKVLVTY